MRAAFDSINALNLKYIKDGGNLKIYIPLKDRILSYLFHTDGGKIEKVSEYHYNDDILDFHIDNENLVLIGKANKAITTFDKNSQKISER
jgi:hypothetical protein